jgi:hypothetical protein
MRIYYLDLPLTDDELSIVKELLDQEESPEIVGELEQIRVPYVLPTPDRDGKWKTGDTTAHVEHVKKNLMKSGVLKDSGRQIAFVVPEQIYWGSVIQLAIYEMTGFYPYAIQPWIYDEIEGRIRRDLRVINGHGMMGGKE